MSHIHWVGRGTGTPKDRDEVNNREVSERDGWVCDWEVIGAPSRLRLIRKAAALARIFPHFDFSIEENAMGCFFCVHIFFLFHFCGAFFLTLFVIWRVEFKWFFSPKNIFSCRGCFWPLFFQLKCFSPCLSATQILSFDMVSATSTAVSKEKGEGGTEEWEEHERSGCRI